MDAPRADAATGIELATTALLHGCDGEGGARDDRIDRRVTGASSCPHKSMSAHLTDSEKADCRRSQQCQALATVAAKIRQLKGQAGSLSHHAATIEELAHDVEVIAMAIMAGVDVSL